MIIKLYLWLSVFVILRLVLSYNTLISMLCFSIVILISCSLLFILRLEFLAYIILLIYLGGIIIFFLFSILLLNLNFVNTKNLLIDLWLYIQHILLLLFFLKTGYFLLNLYQGVCAVLFETNFTFLPYIFDTYVETMKSNSLIFGMDSYVFIRLYEDKAILLIVLGVILFFVVFAVITLCYKKCSVKY
jgi:NADH:ubiquinone oxidoreductase subunit 6 (subunit J)